MDKSEPWYIHIVLYVIIAILTLVLIKVAIIDPKKIVDIEKYSKQESRLRMKDIKVAEMLWYKKHKRFSGSLDSLVTFLKTDPSVDSAKNAMDTLTNRSANPFVDLSNGQFTPESLYYAPQSHRQYTLNIDTTTGVDTVVNRRGKIMKIDTVTKIGTLYYLEDPDGYGSIGSLTDSTQKNNASWE
jgi:hypothetical protein